LGGVLRQHLPLLLACVLLSIICGFALAANTQPLVG
jgi:cation transporter-like permease